VTSGDKAQVYSHYAMGGAEWDGRSGSFAYIGTGIQRAVSRRYSLTGKVFYGDLKYRFDSAGETLTAKVPIFNAQVGLSFKGDWYVLGGSVGVDLRETEKELVTGGTQTDNEAGIAIQAETYMWGQGKKSLGIIASYSTIDDFFWGRARAKKGVYEPAKGLDLKIGAELVGMGNSDFSSIQAGAIVELYKNAGDLSFLIKGGIKSSSDIDSTGYAGLEIYKGF
jgi:hypothetical protein